MPPKEGKRHCGSGFARARDSTRWMRAFDTVLWMYRRSSRGSLFEAGRNAQPTTQPG
jgi:hypothetical protein